jgi:hypothetical protein
MPPTPPAGYPSTGGSQTPGGYRAPGGYQAPGPTGQPTGFPSTPGTPPPPGSPTGGPAAGQAGNPAGGQAAAPNPRQTGRGGLNDFINQLGGQANMMGILSALLGLLSVVCCVCTSFGGGGAYFFTLILAIPAVGLGILHLTKVRAGQATNQNLAFLGIALGILGLLIAICGGTTSVGTDINHDIR